MFHGCRSADNEESIIQDGFSVPKCVSGGSNYGTWLAYIAAYSDSGFAFDDSQGVRHLFVALVTETDVRRDDGQVMRVVGPDCAYPMYVLTYQRVSHLSMAPAVPLARPAGALGPARKHRRH